LDEGNIADLYVHQLLQSQCQILFYECLEVNYAGNLEKIKGVMAQAARGHVPFHAFAREEECGYSVRICIIHSFLLASEIHNRPVCGFSIPFPYPRLGLSLRVLRYGAWTPDLRDASALLFTRCLYESKK